MKTLKSEWIILWNGIKSLLGDKPLVSAIAGLIAAYVVARDPNLTVANVQNGILVIVGLVVGTYKAEDIVRAIAGIYTAKSNAAVTANTAALTANTASMDINTKVTAARPVQYTSGVPTLDPAGPTA